MITSKIFVFKFELKKTIALGWYKKPSIILVFKKLKFVWRNNAPRAQIFRHFRRYSEQ